MLLSDRTIRRRVDAGEIRITPWVPDHVQPAGVDLTLGPELQVPRSYIHSGLVCLDPWGPVPFDGSKVWEPVTMTDEGYILAPHSCVLASTREFVELPPDVKATADGRSSVGRLFVQIHSTAGFIDPGFKGTITLEISNQSPWSVKLRVGARIGQLSFIQLDHPAERPYGHPALKSRYQGQTGAVPSRLTSD